MTAARPAAAFVAALGSAILLFSPDVRTQSPARDISRPSAAGAFSKLAPATDTLSPSSSVTLQWEASAPLLRAAAQAAQPLTFEFGVQQGIPFEARAAMQRVFDLIAAELALTSPVPGWVEVVRFRVINEPVQVSMDSIQSDFPGAPFPNTGYVAALASKLTGVDLTPTLVPDIEVNLNVGASFYFGLDGNPPPDQFDFVTAALRAVVRGLGIITFPHVDTATGLGTIRVDHSRMQAFDRFIENGAGDRLSDETRFPENSIAMGNLLQSNDLWWNGPHARAANGGVRPKLYAPRLFDGMTRVGLLDEASFPRGTANSLLTPIIAPGEAIHTIGPVARGMLLDLGWLTSTRYEYCVDRKINAVCDASWTPVGAALGATVSGLASGTTYEWQVRATTGAQYTMADGGTWFRFTTDRVPAVRGDFNRDGTADLVVYRFGQWLINGQGTRVVGAAGDVPVPGDYNGDAAFDAVVWRPSSGQWVLPGVGLLLFGRTGDIPVPADYDGNGTTDLAVFRTTDDHQGRWFIKDQFATAWGARGDVPVPADYDGDRKADPAVFRPSNSTWYIVHSSNGYMTHSQKPFGLPGDAPVPADYDGDGRTDLAVFRRSTGDWFIALASTNYAATEWRQWGLAGDEPVPLDVDGDGVDDLVVYRPGNSTWHAFSRMTNAPILSRAPDMAAAQALGQPGDIPAMRRPRIPSTSASDFDGDGRADITVFRQATGQWFTRLSSSNYATTAAQQWGLNGDIEVPGDYDGDGRTDVAVYRPANGRWYIAFSSTGFTTSREEAWGQGGDVPMPQDYDGDGRTDPAVFRPSTGQWFAKPSGPNFGPVIGVLWGTPGDVPIPADYDGDGCADFAVYRPSTNTFLLQLTGGFAATISKSLGAPGDVPAVADFDGDGRADLAMFRPTIGRWFVVDALTSVSPPELQWGQIGDTPVPHDFDGDGMADAAIFRSASGMWFARRSSDGSMLAVQWGLSTDVPVMRDSGGVRGVTFSGAVR